MTRLATSSPAVSLVALGVAGLVVALRPGPHVAPPPPRPATTAVIAPPAVAPVPPIRPPSTDRDVPVPDLDGDGKPEQLDTQPDSCGTGGCVFDLYLSSRPQARAGTIAGKWGYWSATPRRTGPADLTTTWFLGCCEIELTTYRFRRGAYREIRRRSCDPREGHRPACDEQARYSR